MAAGLGISKMRLWGIVVLGAALALHPLLVAYSLAWPNVAISIVGKIEFALHSLNNGGYSVASLVSIGSAKLDTPDGPIRF
jgi:hypothetical protein